MLDGQRPSKKFGSNCYEQARSLRNTLIAAGFSKAYLVEDMINGRHRSVLCPIQEKLFLVDPYLMHCEPIDISTIVNSYSADSFPITRGEKSILTLRRQKDLITITKSWPYQNRIDTFTINISNPCTHDLTRAQYFERAFHPKQTTLSIRFLNTITGSVDYLAYPIHANKPELAELYIQTSEGNVITQSDSATFNTKLEELTALIDSNNAEVIDFLHEAINLRKKLLEETPIRNGDTIVPFPYTNK